MVNGLRFGAWVLKELQTLQDKQVKLVLQSDLGNDTKNDRFDHIPGLNKETNLSSPDITLTLQPEKNGELKLTGNFKQKEQFTNSRQLYRTKHVEAGRDMFDNWEEAHDEEIPDGVIHFLDTRNTDSSQTVPVTTRVFSSLFSFIQALKVDEKLLLKQAALSTNIPNLDKVLKKLGATTEELKKVLLENNLESNNDLNAAFKKDSPFLKKDILSPIRQLLANAGNKLACEFEEERKNFEKDLQNREKKFKSQLKDLT